MYRENKIDLNKTQGEGDGVSRSSIKEINIKSYRNTRNTWRAAIRHKIELSGIYRGNN